AIAYGSLLLLISLPVMASGMLLTILDLGVVHVGVHGLLRLTLSLWDETIVGIHMVAARWVCCTTGCCTGRARPPVAR
ncbi:MAG: hypothetical protein HRU27_21060, partial [Rhizobiaceae bacterium]|nr:hypothetical protein [Rhizobiaceae bacterium]